MNILKKNFVLIMCSQIFNISAAILFNVAIISFVYSETSSVGESTLVLVISTIAAVIGGLIGGTFLDTITHRNVMIFSNIMNFLLILIFSIIITTVGINLITVYITTFILNLISSFYKPARLAIIPSIIEKSSLVKANGLLVSVMQIVQTAGWVVAVPFVTYIGVQYSIYAISLAYLFSGILVLFIQLAYKSTESASEKTSSVTQIMNGIRPLWNNKVIRSITIMDMIENFANIIWVPTFLLAFTIEVLNTSEEWWGFQGAAFFLGLIVGGILTAKYAKKIREFGGKILIYSSLGVAIVTLMYGLNSIALMAVIFSFLVGPPSQVRNVIQESLIQEYADERVLGRVFAARNIILQSIYTVALIIGSQLADQVGMTNIFLVGAFIYIIVTIYALSSQTIRTFNMSSSEIE